MTDYHPAPLPGPETAPTSSKARSHLGWIVALGVVALVWAGAFAIRSAHSGDGKVMTGWADGLEAGQRLAVEHDRPMVVAFTAEW